MLVEPAFEGLSRDKKHFGDSIGISAHGARATVKGRDLADPLAGLDLGKDVDLALFIHVAHQQ
ncbi:hypothetical protein D9M69_717940 [compost metagenome]